VAAQTAGIFQNPCNNCSITQYYHPGHYALDIQTKGDIRPIFAAEAGTVIRAETGWNGGYGNVIEIDHGNGVVTLYGHNEVLYVQKGDVVTRGQEIAKMGHTGRVYGATGIHTHFEVRVNGVKKNPMLYLNF
jgi:murein DD-endopeptidase MepM/ murein hydrolase activator NlpD